MSEHEERRAFDGRHAREPVEIIALTGTIEVLAGKSGTAVLWTPEVQILAHVDEFGSVVEKSGVVSWLAHDDHGSTWIHDLRPATQYRLRVRRATPADPAEYARLGQPVQDVSCHFALVDVTERDLHVPALDVCLARCVAPRIVLTVVGNVILEREFGFFSGTMGWCDESVGVSLDIDPSSAQGSETCDSAAAALEAVVANPAETDAKWRAFVASTMTDLANDWLVQDEGQFDAELITPEDVARRVRLVGLSVAADGSVAAEYDDGELFGGHRITVDIEPGGRLVDAHI